MKQLSLFREIIVDNFAGGGGASTGIELATGRSVDIAINHDPTAIAMHRANHPETEHYCENVWEVNPIKACGGTYNDLSGGDLTITSPDGTVANLCIIVRKTSIYPDVEYGVYGEDF
jgi:hypothetical protein